MELRTLGRTGLKVSALSFGCGAVGGLMVRGDPRDQERAVARAIEHGVTYFDTAPQYGDGASERHIGAILARLGARVQVGTKVRLGQADYRAIGPAIAKAIDASLTRLGRDHVDLYQLHNRIASASAGDALSVDAVLGEVAPAMERLRKSGKARFIGITALGETPAIKAVVEAGAFDVAQVCHNMLNPSAAATLPAGLPGQDYDRLLSAAGGRNMGTIAIRILAGGALSGSNDRHPTSMASVAPIGSGAEYGADVARARAFLPLVAEGHAGSLAQLAVRYVLSTPGLSTVLIGLATPEELETAAAAAQAGPLPAEALQRIAVIQRSSAGAGR